MMRPIKKEGLLHHGERGSLQQRDDMLRMQFERLRGLMNAGSKWEEMLASGSERRNKSELKFGIRG